jgi:hypothetical protein
MTRLANVFNARRIVQGAATVLTVTLALTVRVEHACSEPSKSNVSAYPAVLFAYSMKDEKPRILSDTGLATGGPPVQTSSTSSSLRRARRPTLLPQSRLDSREMVPAMPQRMILHHELRRHRRAVAQ